MKHLLGAAVLPETITSTMLQGVLDEVVGVIPTVLPVVITFLAIRKRISFVIGMLFGAEVALLAATAFISHRFAKKQKALENAEEKSETAQKEDEE